jgi:hypothetical protein
MHDIITNIKKNVDSPCFANVWIMSELKFNQEWIKTQLKLNENLTRSDLKVN